MPTFTINNATITVNRIWYVSPNGDNTTGDGTQANPYASYNKAAQMATSGDGIYLQKGFYNITEVGSNLALVGTPTYYSCIAFYDYNKNLTVWGDGAKTVFYYDNSIFTDYRDNNVFGSGSGGNENTSVSTFLNFSILYKNAGSGYGSAVFARARGIYKNIYIETVGTTALSLTYYNSQTATIYPYLENCQINCNGNSAVSFSGYLVMKNCLHDADTSTSSNGAVHVVTNSISRANDFSDHRFGIVANDLKNTGDAAVLNPDGSRSHIGLLGGSYAWSKISNLVNSPSKSIIGDYISQDYVAPSTNAFGYFQNLGASVYSRLSTTTPGSNPKGRFYWIHVATNLRGQKVYVADRNIQQNISYDTLNNMGLATTQGMSLYDPTFPIVTAYDFNETQGTKLYSKTSPAFDGTFNGTAPVTGYNNIGYARNFNGTSGYITFSNVIIPTGSKSIRFKMKASSFVTNMRILSTGIPATDTSEYQIAINSTGQVFMIIRKSGTTIVSLATTVNVCDGTWKDILFIQNDTTRTIEVYINGTLNASGSYVSGQNDDTGYARTLVVGAAYATSTPTYNNYFAGQIDQLEIYSGVISTTKSIFDISSVVNYTLRLPSGGISSTDYDNDWDRYITSTIDGLDYPTNHVGIWNQKFASWTLSTQAAYTSASNRVVRGGMITSTYAEIASSTNNATYGFRPMLIIEFASKSYYLVKDSNNNVLHYTNNSWQTLMNGDPTEETFNLSANSAITSIPVSAWTSFTAPVSILYWSNDSSVDDRTMLYTGTPKSQLVTTTSDFTVPETGISSVFISNTLTGSGTVKMVVSVDGGTTWKTFNGSWNSVSSLTLSNILSSGMTLSTLHGITAAQWISLLDKKTTIRFAYALSTSSASDQVVLDQITLSPNKGTIDQAFTDVLNHALTSDLYQQTSDYLFTQYGLYQIQLNAVTNGSAAIKVIVSGDGGATWYTYNGTWSTVTNTKASIIANGMNHTTLNNLSYSAWKNMLGSAQRIRLAYVITSSNGTDQASISSVRITPAASGSPTISPLSIVYSEKSIIGKLTKFETEVTKQLLELHLKAKTLLSGAPYDLHHVHIDTFATNTSLSGTTSTYNSSTKTFGVGTVYYGFTTETPPTKLLFVATTTGTVSFYISIDGGTTYNASPSLANTLIDLTGASNSIAFKINISGGGTFTNFGIIYA